MNENSKQDLFETMPVPKAVASLTVPTIIGSLVMIIYNLADTYFVGGLNNPVQNAAVTLAAPVLLAFNAVNNLFGVGSSSMMSRALGTKEYDTVKQSSAFGFYCSAVSGILFSIIYALFSKGFLKILGADSTTSHATSQYLFWTVTCGAAPAIINVVMGYLIRAEGAALHSSIGHISGCVLNIILDPIFIMPWGLNMGAAGAGCATFISNCFSCLYFFAYIYLKRGSTFVCINPVMARCGSKVIKGVCGVGIPAAIQNILNVTGMTILNNFTAAFGSVAVAAMGIANKLQLVPIYMAMGFSGGVMPLIGYNFSSGNIKRMKDSFDFAAKLEMAFLLVLMLIFVVFPKTLVGLFIENEAVVEYGAAFVIALGLVLPFAGMDFLGVNVFQACGMGKTSLMFAILRKLILEIPALFILNRLFPLYGLPYAQLCSEVILAAAAVGCLKRIFKNAEE